MTNKPKPAGIWFGQPTPKTKNPTSQGFSQLAKTSAHQGIIEDRVRYPTLHRLTHGHWKGILVMLITMTVIWVFWRML